MNVLLNGEQFDVSNVTVNQDHYELGLGNGLVESHPHGNPELELEIKVRPRGFWWPARLFLTRNDKMPNCLAGDQVNVTLIDCDNVTHFNHDMIVTQKAVTAGVDGLSAWFHFKKPTTRVRLNLAPSIS